MNIPTKLTVSRIICIPIFIILWYLPFGGSYDNFFELKQIIMTVFFTLLCLTDWLDGYLARKYNLITDLGKFLDPIADKVLVFTIYLLFISINILDPITVLLMLTREFIVASVRMLEASGGNVIAANKSGKIKTILQMFSLILLLIGIQNMNFLLCWFTYLIYGLSVLLTLTSGWNYIHNYLKNTAKEKSHES